MQNIRAVGKPKPLIIAILARSRQSESSVAKGGVKVKKANGREAEKLSVPLFDCVMLPGMNSSQPLALLDYVCLSVSPS